MVRQRTATRTQGGNCHESPVKRKQSYSPFVGIQNFHRKKKVQAADEKQKSLDHLILGVSTSSNQDDKGETVKTGTYSGYWGLRIQKLEGQIPDESIYGQVSSTISEQYSPSLASPSAQGYQKTRPPRSLFNGLFFYFNGRMQSSYFIPESLIDSHRTNTGRDPEVHNSNLLNGVDTSLHLSKLIRLHGGSVLPFFAKKKVTHVVCSNLSGSGTERALKSRESCKSSHIFYISYHWIIQCIQQNRLLPERDFDILGDYGRTTKPIDSYFKEKSNPSVSN